MFSRAKRALILALTACGMAGGLPAQAQNKALEPLLINYTSPNAIWWNIDVAIDKGFLRDEGFQPEGTPFQNSPQAVQLLVSKSVHAAVIQPEALMDADLKGAGLVAVIQTETRPDWLLVVRTVDPNVVAQPATLVGKYQIGLRVVDSLPPG